MAISEARDYYRLLQVDPDAEHEVIAAAYRRLATKYHPDINPSPDAEVRMRDINAAYEILRDPEQRAAYDRARGLEARARARPAAGAQSAAASPGLEGFLRALVMMVISGIILNFIFSAFAGPGGRWIAGLVIVALLLWKGGPIFRYFSGGR